MRAIRFIVVAVMSGFVVACAGSVAPVATAPAPAVAVAPATTAAARTQAIVEAMLKDRPAVSVAVASNGTVVLSKAFGWADVASRRPATPDTRFRIYSNTKPIAAAVALRLARMKKLDLDAPVSTSLRDLPDHLGVVTVRQLLAHVGGVRHYKKNEWMSVSSRHCTSARDGLAPFVNDPLVAAPQVAFNYSSFGYVLASAIMEEAARQPFYDLLTEQIFTPARMTHTGPDGDMKGDNATPYESAAKVAPRADNSCKAGAGGLASTAEDLARFGAALLDGTLLTAEELSAMTAAAITTDGKPNEYGLGIVHTTDPILGKIFIHSGGALGGRSYLFLAPDHKIVVALASNVEGEGLRPQALAIAQAFMAEKKHGVR